MKFYIKIYRLKINFFIKLGADSTLGCTQNPNSIAFDYQSCAEIPIVQESNYLTDMFPTIPFTHQIRKDYCKRRWNITVRDPSNYQIWNKKVARSATNIAFVDSVRKLYLLCIFFYLI